MCSQRILLLCLDVGKSLKEVMKAYLKNSSIVDFLKAYLNIRIQGKNDRNNRYPRSNMKTAILGLQRWLYSEHL
jgi:hypothetical protein